MFSKLLIANRGEIACRIISACRKLGIKTVAVYSDADRETLHVELADEAHPLGPAPPQDSYLRGDRVLEIARRSGAQAIHPGYGFLAENAEFARHCQEAGLKFIGPSPELMDMMGDKLQARKLARKAGLPVLPGTDEAVDDKDAIDRARALGFPLMVKSAEGGGGIGIHVVESVDELLPLVERTRKVAANAFGSARLYFERYLKDASHIEVQLIGDEQGNLLHLHERDCSVQRRNQKLIEETPAAKLTLEVRQRICSWAVGLGRYLGYSNAGTVEFLLSTEGQIYFLEVNTRLQVEHGITELVNGVDLVEWQIRVAAGESLPLEQDDIRARGHAIEARIYPEDPETLLPDVGTVTELCLPTGSNVRVDTALGKGYEVTIHYEPLLAKVMAWGETREDSVRELLGALLEFRLDGIKCNIPLLQDFLGCEEFGRASYHTGSLLSYMERHRLRQGAIGQIVENGTSHMNGNGRERENRELAAAIGAALALALQGSQPAATAAHAPGAWRMAGRREQLLSRSVGNRGWR